MISGGAPSVFGSLKQGFMPMFLACLSACAEAHVQTTTQQRRDL